MRLADFILFDMEGILKDWQTFAAAQLPAAASMNALALRDHAEQILEAVAKDIVQPQTRVEQIQKSKGRAPQVAGAAATAAQAHAVMRAHSGFDIRQMTAEYRALRTSVLCRWVDTCEAASTDLQDMIRFNEAIDQAIAESVGSFSTQVEQSRNFFLGMLGHDMRSPLSAILLSAGYLAKLNAGERVSDAAKRIINSGSRMQALLDDLIDFNRTKLGLGISIAPSQVDLAQVFADGLQQLRVAYPSCDIQFAVEGDARGVWDANRLHQLLDNLVVNAIKYGFRDSPVRVTLAGNDEDVVLTVRNRGPVIEPPLRTRIFDPLRRGSSPPSDQDREGDGSLGLGLFISREIAIAHGGDIDVESDESETVFTVRLPRAGSHHRQNLMDRSVASE
jgi:signal transduction histidine kinase